MKKILFIIFALFAFVAQADNVITSKEYVDTQASSLQEQISANDANTVLTYTDTAGTVGEKKIYDSSAAYNEQVDSLVTAGAFNTAIQNALETEFVCIDWLGDVHDNAHCLLYQIRSKPQQQILPAGYTQLEYLESTGTQYINTGIEPNNNIGASIKYALTEIFVYNDVFGIFVPYVYIGIGASGNSMVVSFRDKNQVTDGSIVSIPLSQTQLNYPYTANINFYNSGVIEVVGLEQTNVIKHQFQSSKNMLLFGLTNNFDNTPKLGKNKIYYAKITNGDSLVRNFIPARRDSDGVLGMYDLVSNTFFTNKGTGRFIAGPVVYF